MAHDRARIAVARYEDDLIGAGKCAAQRRAVLIVGDANRGSRRQSAPGGLGVASHRDGLDAQRSQLAQGRAADIPASASDENQIEAPEFPVDQYISQRL